MLKALKYNPVTGKYEATDINKLLPQGVVSLMSLYASREQVEDDEETTELRFASIFGCDPDEPPRFETRPEDCVCSDQAYEIYGCMCRERRMPQ